MGGIPAHAPAIALFVRLQSLPGTGHPAALSVVQGVSKAGVANIPFIGLFGVALQVRRHILPDFGPPAKAGPACVVVV